jgi:putative endonuclease
MKRREIGILGEKLAGDFLREHGYEILETNYRSPYGEIDLIAQQGDYLVFIEVRTKRSHDFGSPEESITQTKREHLTATAWHYLESQGNPPCDWRIDAVAIELDHRNQPLRIDLIENAVNEES